MQAAILILNDEKVQVCPIIWLDAKANNALDPAKSLS